MEWWKAVLVGMNLAFAAVGFFTYIPQLSATPVWLWVFTPDCPAGWLLFALAYVNKNNTLRFFAFVAGVKYAVWTLATQVFYWYYFIQVPLWMFAVVATHIILLVEVFLLKPRFSWSMAVPTFAFFALADVSDYILGTWPWLPSAQYILPLAWTAVVLTLAAPLIPLAWQTINRRKNMGGT